MVGDPGVVDVGGELQLERLTWPEIRDALEAGKDTQADLIETSIMLALHPTLVRRDRIEPGFVGDFDLELSFAERGVKALTGNGILGDPTAATAELGEEILAHLEQYLLDATAAASKERA
jgi:creatinine amidohydrolase